MCIQESEAYAEITGSFLNQFETGIFGHNPLPYLRAVAEAVDVVEIRFDPDLCIGDGTITFQIPTTVRNERLMQDTFIIISTFEILGGQSRMTKGGDVVYEAPMCSEATAHRQPFDQLSGPSGPERRRESSILE